MEKMQGLQFFTDLVVQLLPTAAVAITYKTGRIRNWIQSSATAITFDPAHCSDLQPIQTSNFCTDPLCLIGQELVSEI